MERDYKKEYKKFQSSEEQKKKRAERNKVRRKALKKGTVSKGDNIDMSHTKNGIVKKHKSANRGSKSDMPGDIKARGNGQKKKQPKK
jgi:sialic acid synthase SpsE